ncbi:RNase H domain protein [Aspergillus eucalypticola CBS 122712]|uniref:ribonuclease H n=1 Tax=Aspergillus eucalypticola (strain CBS 122712 / IBT 29274) TaxID=1448314 RepID=A0A317VDG1_ASPEC|nr:RNase H domain protein [Aspergillus eucalypticola CBS 122712]PWY71301.1 RNase H domain protein [Aspergillus eucalypticola CBS 122712]
MGTLMVVINPIMAAGGYDNDRRVGTGRVLPTKFNPPYPDDAPHSLFPPGIKVDCVPQVHRFIRRNNPRELLIYTNGTCVENGGAVPRGGCGEPRGGCGVVYRSPVDLPEGKLNHFKIPLEIKGPSGRKHRHTSERAELRAVIAALRFRCWTGEGFNKLVIATDSEYVVEGATCWIQGWIQRGWKTRTGNPVSNRDLWECLLGELERWYDHGMDIQFWQIPKEWNTEAALLAEQAALEAPARAFGDVSGYMV